MFSTLPRMMTPEPRDRLALFSGGLDVETPAWVLNDGVLRDALNYEIAVEDGYQDIAGYERFDGRPSPSDASFTILDVEITGSIEVGDTVTGAVSGATGVVIAIDSYPNDPDQQYLVMTKVTGDFEAESLTVSGNIEGQAVAEGYADGAPTPKLTAQYKALAANEYRQDIGAVPGEGPVWGGFCLGNDVYAIRNESGGVSAALYKATASGWQKIDLGRMLIFTSGGTYALKPGDTITGASSGATAKVESVQVLTGSFSAGDAAGILVISNQVGTFTAENLDYAVLTDVATVHEDSTPIGLGPSGRLDYDISEFANPQLGPRVYGAYGTGYGFEFDGARFVPIITGMLDDTPDHVVVHKNHLFFLHGNSVQHSGVGDPLSWQVSAGAGEFLLDKEGTGFMVTPGDAGGGSLLIACQQQLYTLYGNDPTDWTLVRYRENIGAYRWTLQELASNLFLDDQGITDLHTAEAFGNFQHSALSTRIQRIINQKRPLAVASCVCRAKNQYRLFFSDRTAIYLTMNGRKVMGMMPVQFANDVTCAWAQEMPDGNERLFFGSSNGYVYEMERGTSFDGEPIYAYIYTHFDHQKALGALKSYFGPVRLEGRSTGYAEISIAYELDYADPDTPQPFMQSAAFSGSKQAQFDTGLVWDTDVVWDQSSNQPTIGLDLRGDAYNIAWVITKNSDYTHPVLLSGVLYGYLPRRRHRG